MILKKLGWKRFKKNLLVKVKEHGVLGSFVFTFEDTINNCILHEYVAPPRRWEKWEISVVYGIFRMECKEMLE